MHKHHNYLHSILKQKVFTKVIKNAKLEVGSRSLEVYKNEG
jgi:hypothetical protein